MKVFASKYLEPLAQGDPQNVTWIWAPANKDALETYASSPPRVTQHTTYSRDADVRSDISNSELPIEGMLEA
jgi:hypothetical protein